MQNASLSLYQISIYFEVIDEILMVNFLLFF